MGRETKDVPRDKIVSRDFNPLPPWGGRPSLQQLVICQDTLFQSTPSVGRETTGGTIYNALHSISIHSLRGEGDIQIANSTHKLIVFQSTPSVGRETAYLNDLVVVQPQFQSTPSVGRETRPPALSRHGVAVFQSTPSVGRETGIA